MQFNGCITVTFKVCKNGLYIFFLNLPAKFLSQKSLKKTTNKKKKLWPNEHFINTVKVQYINIL